MCMVKARSAFDFGASTPAGEKRGSLMRAGSSLPIHFVEYGGLETIASKGSSSQCAGSVSVDPAQVVGGQVDLLAEEPSAHVLLTEHLCELQ